MYKLTKCNVCHGSGKARKQKGYFSELVECDSCTGHGNVISFNPLLPSLFTLIFKGVKK